MMLVTSTRSVSLALAHQSQVRMLPTPHSPPPAAGADLMLPTDLPSCSHAAAVEGLLSFGVAAISAANTYLMDPE